MSFAVEVKGLAGGYPNREVLRQIQLGVRPGECVALLGPNGSGKSTLLKALVRGLPRWQGEVRICGAELATARPHEIARQVALVPQEETARFAFRVADVVAMGRLCRSDGLFDTPEDREKSRKAMERADCAHLADRPYTELSGGERQRVLIARALAQESPVLLLDEPTSHLDPAHQVEVAELVRSLSREGVTSIAAVHDLNLAARIADRGILLRRGEIVLDEAMTTLQKSPLLDEVYGVGFLRVENPEGGVILVPRSATS